MALRGEVDDIGAGEEGEVGVLLHDGVLAVGHVDGAVEVDEGRVPVGLGVVQDALNAGLLCDVVDGHLVKSGLPICECELDSLRAVLEFGAEDGCFGWLVSVEGRLDTLLDREKM